MKSELINWLIGAAAVALICTGIAIAWPTEATKLIGIVLIIAGLEAVGVLYRKAAADDE